MALTNVLVQQSIVNDGQPKALLVDAKGQPLVSNVENSSNKPANEETARETSLNIQRMVDLLEVIAKGVSGRDSNALEENTDSKMNFGNMLGFYGAMLISKLFGALFSGIAAASRFIFKGVLPFLTRILELGIHPYDERGIEKVRVRTGQNGWINWWRMVSPPSTRGERMRPWPSPRLPSIQIP